MEFKLKLDAFVIRASDLTLVSLGLTKAFSAKLRRFVILVTLDKTQPLYQESFSHIVKNDD